MMLVLQAAGPTWAILFAAGPAGRLMTLDSILVSSRKVG